MPNKSMSAIRPALRPLSFFLIQIGFLSSAFGLGPAGAQALPTGGVVKVGDAVINAPTLDGTMTINQKSNLALIQWSTFTIGTDSKLIQTAPNASDLTIHRVFDPKLGPSQAEIQGQFLSDHRVFLISPGGVLVTNGAVIDAPSVVLSGRDLSPDLVSGDYAKLKAGATAIVLQDDTKAMATFAGASRGEVNIQSGATLKAGTNGTVMLVGDKVTQNGTIVAGAGGQVILAAVGQAEIQIGDSGFLTLSKTGADPDRTDASRSVVMSGQIDVAGGEVRLMAEQSVTLNPGAAIQSSDGPVNVSLQSDILGDRAGGVHLNGSFPATASRIATAKAVPMDGVSILVPLSFTDVTINTGGGSLAIGGGVDGVSAAGVSLSYAQIDTTNSKGGAGDVSIRSRVDSSARGSSFAPAVGIDGSNINAGSVSITGLNVGATGVDLYQSTLTGSAGGVDIRGVASGAPTSFGIGVNIGSGVVINGGKGNVTIAGRGVTQGVTIEDLVITTAGIAGQQITLAGQTTGSAQAGIGLNTDGGRAIRIHDEAGGSLASGADLIVGATGGPGATMALDLGTGDQKPEFNLSGRANYRPLGVDEFGNITESRDAAIQLGAGAPGAATNFVLLPEWFNPSVNDVLPSVTVVGSSGHTGQISTATGVLDGAKTLTLQNQGVGSKGIIVGGSPATGSGVDVLSLLSTGDISQTGDIHAGALNVIAPASVKVSLNNPGNRVGRLSIEGAADSSVSGESVPAASSSSGIPGFRSDSESADFETLAITRGGPPVTVGPELSVVPPAVADELPKHFELPPAIEEQRTDVYVRDHFSRPQVCTAANVSTTGLSVDADIEPLTLEWVKVRRSPQLSSCSGVRVDSACSAF